MTVDLLDYFTQVGMFGAPIMCKYQFIDSNPVGLEVLMHGQICDRIQAS